MTRLPPLAWLAVIPALALVACQRGPSPDQQGASTTPSPTSPADATPPPVTTPEQTTTRPAAASPAPADRSPVDGTIRNAAERSMSDAKHIEAVPRGEDGEARGANRHARPAAGKPVPPVERRVVTPDDADRKLPAARVPGRGEAGDGKPAGATPAAPAATPIATPTSPPRLPRPRITETPRG